ncbi:hypothetical protein K445DRAFT_316747 [Daldinia sp. EC12]|nr:hypothetical protein F4774DRAFT_391724 [Daldinia eschscholtzii]OTB16472.1 hypothetical protein K445DRAFT_316747 [Daldinia sp. EC12]
MELAHAGTFLICLASVKVWCGIPNLSAHDELFSVHPVRRTLCSLGVIALLPICMERRYPRSEMARWVASQPARLARLRSLSQRGGEIINYLTY